MWYYTPIVLVDDLEEVQPTVCSADDQRGIVYICPECGEVWAKIVLMAVDHYAKDASPHACKYSAEEVRCVNCGDGSFLTKWVFVISPWLGIVPEWGPQLIIRELEIAEKYKGIRDETCS